MARSYLHGKLVDQIDFDSSCPFTMTGGNGDIYRGSLILDVHPDGSPRRFCHVALKSMRCGTEDVDNRLVKIIDEAAVWKDLHHPHILRFLGLLTDIKGIYLVAPFAKYGSLPQYLVINPDADRPMFLAQTAAGLAYLHEQGIVHGDVKGANILVFDGPSARICDFGLAKQADPNPGTTQNNVGSLYWMSPERLQDQTRTQESDVYAFGLTIYEILSGSIPFVGMTFVAVYGAVHSRKERPPTQPQSSTTGVSYALLWELAIRCWSQLATERPPMGEVFDAIVASIGKYVEGNDDDLPIISTSLPPVTVKRRRQADGPPMSSDTGESGAESGDIPPLPADRAQDVETIRPAKRAKVDAPVDNSYTKDVADERILMIPEAVGVNSANGYPSASLPARPDTFFGREQYIENVVERLCYFRKGGEGDPPALHPPRLAILGPGGIGKTTVALTAVTDHRVKAAYEDRIHWVPCEEATTRELLVELVARSMGVSATKAGDRKGDIIDFLRSSTTPRLLLLDNFETPWDIPTKQTEVNNFLYDIAGVSPLTILLTMRSDILPQTKIRWTEPALLPLASLLPEPAREMYLDIHKDAGEDAELAGLLHELAYMPLAVKLMATRGSMGEMPSTLLALWKDERIRAKLLHQGDDRITSVTVSVELSINSHQMRSNPDALSLLSILAELPGGARHDFVKSIAPSIVDCGGALGTLRRAALVQINPSTRQIQLLSPVRSLVLGNYRAREELQTAVRHAYFNLIHEYSSRPGDELFLKAVPLFTLEAVNIESILMDAMNVESSEACISAAITYAEIQSFNIPRAEIIEKAIVVVQSIHESYGQKLLPRGLALMAIIYRMIGRYQDALDAVQHALPIFQQIGDRRGEANCLDSLGDIYRMMGRYADALDAVQKALPIFQCNGDQLSEANCLVSFGDIYRKTGRYEDALDAAQKALPIFERISDLLGEANCLVSLGDAYQMMGRCEDALGAVRKALSIFQRIQDLLGEANCLDSLGGVYRMMGQYEDALDAAQKALPIFQRIGNQLGEANCLWNIGDAYRMMGWDKNALDAAQMALPIFRRIGYQLGEANCLWNIGDVYQRMGRYEDALDVARNALPIFQRIGSQLGQANSLVSFWDAYQMMGRYEEALDAAQKALPIFQRIGDFSGEANCLVSLGDVYQMMDRCEEALDAVQKALQIYQRIGAQLGEANCFRSLARTYGQSHRTEEGVHAVQAAAEIFLRLGRDSDVRSCRNLLDTLCSEVS